MELPGRFDHPAWTAAIGTVLGYAIALAVLTALVFGIPYALFVLS